MHQNQWLAAIEELKADGLEGDLVPSSFPAEEQHDEVAFQLWDLSSGTDARQGRWASGSTPDGRGTFEYLEDPSPTATEPMQPAGDPRLHDTGSGPGRS